VNLKSLIKIWKEIINIHVFNFCHTQYTFYFFNFIYDTARVLISIFFLSGEYYHAKVNLSSKSIFIKFRYYKIRKKCNNKIGKRDFTIL